MITATHYNILDRRKTKWCQLCLTNKTQKHGKWWCSLEL